MRLIDADALYASIAKDTYLLTDESNSRDYGLYLIGIKKKIDEAPAADVVEVTDKSMESLIKGLEILGDIKDRADVVEVIRCKDCRYHGMRGCPVWGDDTTEDYMWCYYGEREEI